VNNVWNEIEKFCKERDFIAYTFSSQMLDGLNPDTYYRVELRAHNAIGFSIPTNAYLKTARGEGESILGDKETNNVYSASFESTSSSLKMNLDLSIAVFIIMMKFFRF
jgi:hypothetical protein